MKIYIISTISEYGNELAELTRTFFPEKEVSIVKEIPCNKDQGDILINCSHRLAQKELDLKIEYIKYQNEPLVLLE